MKKLGIVGGMGPQSTIHYYDSIIYKVHDISGKKCFPEISLESIDLFRVVDLCKEERYDELTYYLLKAIKNLYASGAEFAALSANTAHIVFDRLKELSPIPLVSIVESTCNKVLQDGFKTVGLLGTVFTMEKEFYKKPFKENNIRLVIPKKEEREFINDKIYQELQYNTTDTAIVNRFIEIIERMKNEDDIEAVILGCTELPMILNNENSPIPCLDTVKIHIDSIVSNILV